MLAVSTHHSDMTPQRLETKRLETKQLGAALQCRTALQVAASPWTKPDEKTPGNERSRPMRQSAKRRRPTIVPAAWVNASGRFEFPHSGTGTDRGGSRFRQQRHGVDHG